MIKMPLFYTNEVQYDIADLASQILIDFGIDDSLSFVDYIFQRCDKLATDHDMYDPTDLIYGGNIIRKLTLSPTLVFYVTLDYGVHILRALREERDWKVILRTQTKYTYDDN